MFPDRATEEMHTRELSPHVMREVMSQPATSSFAAPCTATEPRRLAKGLRERINPAYATTIGTLSYERWACAEAIEGLLTQHDQQAARVKWMAERITYLEHKNREGVICAKAPVGQYWPQGEHEEDNADADMVGLTLIEYVDAQITKEAK